MQPGDIVTLGVGIGELGDDLLEVQRSGVDDPGLGWAQFQQVVGHDRSRVQADPAALQQALAAHGDEIGRTGAGADEVDRHSTVTDHCEIGISGRHPVNPPSGSPW